MYICCVVVACSGAFVWIATSSLLARVHVCEMRAGMMIRPGVFLGLRDFLKRFYKVSCRNWFPQCPAFRKEIAFAFVFDFVVRFRFRFRFRFSMSISFFDFVFVFVF